MPGTVAEGPSVSLSFANNFWGKDDAGVSPLLERMHNAKLTGDELNAFYKARTALEEEYARKLLSLARKPLGSGESGTLRMSLDVIRGEVESMGKAHQNIAQQMKTELDESLAAFAGGMKERRKIVQGGIEKLLKAKNQQTQTVNKTRDKYEQDCLKIKGYLAQGHMVMGQEERKNKAKLEKTQIQLSTTSNEYEQAVKVVEETTLRWNRDWKTACDKFQDLEEERIDFMKNSLWSFANIASTVCVSDDASCEKIRLSLEECEVEKDIASFIKVCGTGQEIPDPPKFINFCRGDINDGASDVSAEDNYQVAQFQRTMNPAFRSSSPQPSNFDPSFDENGDVAPDGDISAGTTPRKPTVGPPQSVEDAFRSSTGSHHSYDMTQGQEDLPQVPHNEYPMDGMTQFCRTGPPQSDRGSSVASPVRPRSRDSQSEYSNPNSFTSPEPSLGAPSPTKGMGSDLSLRSGPDDGVEKKKSGFFQRGSPFSRKAKMEKEQPPVPNLQAGNRNTWAPSSSTPAGNAQSSPMRQQLPAYGRQNSRAPSPSPEPVDPRANFQLNVGNNVFDVASPDVRRRGERQRTDDQDEVAQALAAVKDLTKQSTSRVSADRYHGIATPGPGSSSTSASSNAAARGRTANIPDRTRDAPPPSYNPPPASRLGAPQPAFTSRQMQQTTQKYVDQNKSMFNAAGPGPRYNNSDNPPPQARSRPQSRQDMQDGRSASPSPGAYRSTSPRPTGVLPRAASPNPYLQSGATGNAPPNSRPRAQSSSPQKGPGRVPYDSTSTNMPRSASPQPQFNRSYGADQGRPRSFASDGNMAMQLAQPNHGGPGGYGSPGQHQPPYARQGRGPGPQQRPMSTFGAPPAQGPHDPNARGRRNSAGARQQFTREGRPILHFAKALYMYQAAIPEELSFAKGDVLAVLRLQDDGWWEAEVCGKRIRPGLVPSNYLQKC